MAIDWLNPSNDILDARNVGRQDRQAEIDDLESRVEQIQAVSKQPGQYVACPFCLETDFDRLGLKTHLTEPGWCESYEKIPALSPIPSIFVTTEVRMPKGSPDDQEA